MVFECSNCSLCHVSAMASGWRQLNGDVFIRFEEGNAVCGNLIIEDMKSRSHSLRLQLFDDCRDGLDLDGLFLFFVGSANT